MTYVTEQTGAELRAHMRRLQKMPGWHNPLDDRLFQEVLALDAEIEALRAAPSADVPAVAVQAEPAAQSASVCIDFKQATELLEMFGDEPTEISLMTGDGHSGPGLYAVYNADPEGAVYLGETDEEARPEPAAPIEAVQEQLPTGLDAVFGPFERRKFPEAAQEVSDAEIDWQSLNPHARSALISGASAHPVGAAPVEEPPTMYALTFNGEFNRIWIDTTRAGAEGMRDNYIGNTRPFNLPKLAIVPLYSRAAPVRAVEQSESFEKWASRLWDAITEEAIAEITRAAYAYGNALATSAMDTKTLKAELQCVIRSALAAPKEEPAVLTQGKGEQA